MVCISEREDCPYLHEHAAISTASVTCSAYSSWTRHQPNYLNWDYLEWKTMTVHHRRETLPKSHVSKICFISQCIKTVSKRRNHPAMNGVQCFGYRPAWRSHNDSSTKKEKKDTKFSHEGQDAIPEHIQKQEKQHRAIQNSLMAELKMKKTSQEMLQPDHNMTIWNLKITPIDMVCSCMKCENFN